MPTILEHLAALFDKDMRAVLSNPRAISMIANPSARVQMAAVRRDRSVICFIEKPTEKVQHMAVQRSPDIFRQIRQPEESVRLAAVQAKGENIRYVSAPSEAVQLAAVRNDPMNIRYIENPTEKVQSVVLNADRDAAPFISSPTEEIKRLAMEMYGLRLENAAGKEAAAARTSETSGDSGKKAAEDVAKKPSAKQVREAVEKLDSEIREINREYFQATYEAQYSDNAAERESEVSAAGKNREKKLVKAYEKFNSAAVPERKECNVGKIVKELRKERVAVENMKAGEWHSLMKGKAVQPPLVSGASGAAGKGSALMLARTPAGYALKAAGTINQASRQANAEM